MHAIQLLHNYLQKSVPTIHLKRLTCLLQVASSLLCHAKLTLTSLGRHMPGKAQVKHKIKAVDRLLKNPYLRTERIAIYKALAIKLIGELEQIDVLVDWTKIDNKKWYILRASLVFCNRSMTLYEEVHPETKLGNAKVQQHFLTSLKKILPSTCQVTIVTDCGFKTEWFEQVMKCGWEFEGRVSSNMCYSLDNKKTWCQVATLYSFKSKKPKYLGQVILTKANQLPCEMYVYDKKPTHKAKRNKAWYKTRKNRTDVALRKYRHQQIHPWVLVTSRKHQSSLSPKTVIKRYARRMKIEHEFRDTKDAKWGLGLKQSLTNHPIRLEILLLIGAIAMLCLWLIGVAAERKKLHYHYQSNSIKTHRVLSLIFLGMQIIEHQEESIHQSELKLAFKHIQQLEESICEM